MSKTKDQLKAQLSETLNEAEWNWLKPHSERNGLLIVSRRLDLLEVGLAMAEDDSAKVQPWITQGLIGRPTPDQIESWDQAPLRTFLSIIVQPYVLIQEPLLH